MKHCSFSVTTSIYIKLQNLGECILLPGNLIVLSPEWFWQDVLNWQLSPDQRGRLGGRTTGVYTIEDFQARCPCPATQALQALQAVNLCVPVCSRKSDQSIDCYLTVIF